MRAPSAGTPRSEHRRRAAEASANALATATPNDEREGDGPARPGVVEARVEGKAGSGPARPARGRRGSPARRRTARCATRPRRARPAGRAPPQRPGAPVDRGDPGGQDQREGERRQRPARDQVAAELDVGRRGRVDRPVGDVERADRGLDRAPEGVDALGARSSSWSSAAASGRSPAEEIATASTPSAISGACSPSPDGIARRASCVKAGSSSRSGRPASRPPASAVRSSWTGALVLPLELSTTYGADGSAAPGWETTTTASIEPRSAIPSISSRIPASPASEPLVEATTKVRACWRSPSARELEQDPGRRGARGAPGRVGGVARRR